MSTARGFIEFTDDELAQISGSRRLRYRNLSSTQFIVPNCNHNSWDTLASSVDRFMTKEGKVYLLLLRWLGQPSSGSSSGSFHRWDSREPLNGRWLSPMRVYFTKRAYSVSACPSPSKFQRIEGGRIADAIIEIDPGRFLHLFFFVDGTETSF